MSVAVLRRALLPAAVMLSILVGCTANPQPSPSASPNAAAGTTSGAAVASSTPRTSPTGSYLAQMLAWGRRLAQCARDRGLANFPDPIKADMGRIGLAFPDFPAPKEDINRAMELCPGVLRDEPRPEPAGPPTAAILQRMRQYAECMRQQGASDFPDPRADGTFPIAGTQYAGLVPFSGGPAISNALINKDNACRHHQVGWYVRAS